MDFEIFPEIVRAFGKANGGAGPGACWRGNQGGVGLGQLNLDDDADDFILIAMILLGLLGTVVHGALVGLLDEKGEWGEEADRGYVRARLGHGEKLGVLVEEDA